MWSTLPKLFLSEWEIHPVEKTRFPIYCTGCDTELEESDERTIHYHKVESIYHCSSCNQRIKLRITPRRTYLRNGYWSDVKD